MSHSPRLTGWDDVSLKMIFAARVVVFPMPTAGWAGVTLILVMPRTVGSAIKSGVVNSSAADAASTFIMYFLTWFILEGASHDTPDQGTNDTRDITLQWRLTVSGHLFDAFPFVV